MHIVQLVKLIYDYGLVDHILTKLERENAGKESQAHEYVHVDVERVLDIRIFTRHFILRLVYIFHNIYQIFHLLFSFV